MDSYSTQLSGNSWQMLRSTVSHRTWGSKHVNTKQYTPFLYQAITITGTSSDILNRNVTYEHFEHTWTYLSWDFSKYISYAVLLVSWFICLFICCHLLIRCLQSNPIRVYIRFYDFFSFDISMQPHIYHRTVCLLTECMTSYMTATPCKAQMIIYLHVCKGQLWDLYHSCHLLL